jgi:hypothetical protein
MVKRNELYSWCRIPVEESLGHSNKRLPLRICANSAQMGELMARELVVEIKHRNSQGVSTRAIIPCGPSCWYKPFTDVVNREQISLGHLMVFHMDECLDWQGGLPHRRQLNIAGDQSGGADLINQALTDRITAYSSDQDNFKTWLGKRLHIMADDVTFPIIAVVKKTHSPTLFAPQGVASFKSGKDTRADPAGRDQAEKLGGGGVRWFEGICMEAKPWM